MVKSRSDSWRTFLDELGQELARPTIGRLDERARTLADLVCYEIWGGTRGWERATEAQFDSLVAQLKERLRNDTSLAKEQPEEKEIPPEPEIQEQAEVSETLRTRSSNRDPFCRD